MLKSNKQVANAKQNNNDGAHGLEYSEIVSENLNKCKTEI
jgi:hypothetical protein